MAVSVGVKARSPLGIEERVVLTSRTSRDALPSVQRDGKETRSWCQRMKPGGVLHGEQARDGE